MNKTRYGVVTMLFVGALLLVTSSVVSAQEYRTEHDLLGEKQIPAEAYYGVQTARAIENFQISGTPVYRYAELVNALAVGKLAAARAVG